MRQGAAADDRHHLLLAVSDTHWAARLEHSLSAQGLQCSWIRQAQAASALAGDDGDDDPGPDCCLLDLTVAPAAGLALLQSWRRRGLNWPVIAWLADDHPQTRVDALDQGADDCVRRDCPATELAARVRALVRRASGRVSPRWSLGRLQIDNRLRQVRSDDHAIGLSPTEYRLVHELAQQVGAVVPRRRLQRALAPHAAPLASTALEWHVHNLRRKLGDGVIRTVRGVGYCLVEPI